MASSARLWRLLSLLALAQAAPSTSPSPTLRASRSKPMWVRRPDGGTQIELIPSLSKLCEAEGLDVECMLAVSRGEKAEHRGWTCGTVCEPQATEADVAGAADGAKAAGPTPKRKAAGTALLKKPKSTAAAAAGTSTPGSRKQKSTAPPAAVDSVADLPPAPPSLFGMLGSKMVVQFGASTLASKAVKRMDKEAPGFVQKFRLIFYCLVAARLLIEFLLGWRIAAAADDTALPAPPAADPMSAMLASMGIGKQAQAQTVMDYDRQQLGKTQMNFKISAILLFFMHVLRGWTSTLVYSSASSLVDILYHPLFKIHVLGRLPTGALARPFKAASPMPFAPPSADPDKRGGSPDSPPGGMGGLASLLSGGLGGGLQGPGSLAPAIAAGGSDAHGTDTEGGPEPAAAEDTE